MEDKIIDIYRVISEHLKDSKNGYDETNNDYYFGRLCSSEELHRKIERILFKE